MQVEKLSENVFRVTLDEGEQAKVRSQMTDTGLDECAALDGICTDGFEQHDEPVCES